MRQALHRLGRYFFWSFPALYWGVGFWRPQHRLPKEGFDFWVGGFPRSGNTYLWKTIELSLPCNRVLGHLHIPPMIIRAAMSRIPGIMALRRPQDAALSWAICTNHSIEHCLNYYIDFHRILWPYRKRLLIAPFEEITDDVGAVIGRINERFGLGAAIPDMTEEIRAALNQRIEAMFQWTPGVTDELQVARPSAKRAPLKQQLKEELRASPRLQALLRKAERLHQGFRELAA